jgi:hypothetical protein
MALRSADIVGVDVYPRQALVSAAGWGLYLAGGAGAGAGARLTRIGAQARGHSRRVIVTESQAEPWESTTVPPDPRRGFSSSCTPAHVVETYNRCMTSLRRGGVTPEAYLFWGAEYWVMRARTGDRGYLDAFVRILERA